MKANFIIVIIISILLILLIGGWEQSKIPPFEKNAAGKWVNVDKSAHGTKRVVISNKGNDWLIRAYGVCHPNDCNWGEVPLVLVGKTVSDKTFTHGFAVWDFRYKSIYMILQIKDNHLLTQELDIYKPDDGRSSRISTEEFEHEE